MYHQEKGSLGTYNTKKEAMDISAFGRCIRRGCFIYRERKGVNKPARLFGLVVRLIRTE